MTKVKGPYTAIVTPFDSDQKLNTKALRTQVTRQISHGNNIFCNGTNGEFFILSKEEKLTVLNTCLDQANGDVSVITHIGEITTKETIEHGLQVQSLGCDAVSVITPWFSALRKQDLIAHYSEIADALSIPVYLYNIPARTGNTITPEIAAALAKHPNIFGIKDSAGSFESLSGFQSVANDFENFDLLTGPDSLILKGFQGGAVGCISGIANIVPDKVNAIYTHYSNGEMEKAVQVQEQVNQLRSRLYGIAFAPAVVKKSLMLMGHDVGENRYPVKFNPDDISEIKSVLSELLSITIQ